MGVRMKILRSGRFWAGCALVLVVAVGATVISNRGDDDGRVRIRASSSVPGWSGLSEPPIPATSDPVVTWTGTELVVFGGDAAMEGRAVEPSEAGAAYDPTSETWREIEASPLGPLFMPQAVWTGSEIVIVGVRCEKAAEGSDSAIPACSPGGVVSGAYDPSADEWRVSRVPDGRPFAKSSDVTQPAIARGWTGAEAAFTVAGELWGYRPGSDTWRRLPAMPHAAEVDAICATDAKETIGVVALARRDRDVIVDESSAGLTRSEGAVSRRGGPWSGPAGADIAPALPVGACAGSSILTIDVASGDAARFDMGAGQWAPVSKMPVLPGTSPRVLDADGDPLVFGERSVSRYDIAADTWSTAATSVSSNIISRSAWTGEVAILYLTGSDAPRFEVVEPPA